MRGQPGAGRSAAAHPQHRWMGLQPAAPQRRRLQLSCCRRLWHWASLMRFTRATAPWRQLQQTWEAPPGWCHSLAWLKCWAGQHACRWWRPAIAAACWPAGRRIAKGVHHASVLSHLPRWAAAMPGTRCALRHAMHCLQVLLMLLASFISTLLASLIFIAGADDDPRGVCRAAGNRAAGSCDQGHCASSL